MNIKVIIYAYCVLFLQVGQSGLTLDIPEPYKNESGPVRNHFV